MFLQSYLNILLDIRNSAFLSLFSFSVYSSRYSMLNPFYHVYVSLLFSSHTISSFSRAYSCARVASYSSAELVETLLPARTKIPARKFRSAAAFESTADINLQCRFPAFSKSFGPSVRSHMSRLFLSLAENRPLWLLERKKAKHADICRGK